VSNEKEKYKAIRFFCVKENVWVRVGYDKKSKKNKVKIGL
jgi:hypothetical protein